MLWMYVHMAELVYAPVPKGRVRAARTRAQTPPVQHTLSWGMPSEQPPSQHRGGRARERHNGRQGPALILGSLEKCGMGRLWGRDQANDL